MPVVQNASDRARILEIGDAQPVGSLPLVENWSEWWAEWGPRIAADVGRDRWVLFILDANQKLLEVQTMLSRVIRNKPEWNTKGWSQAEWENVEDQTGAAAAWFRRNMPRLTEVPEWAGFVLAAQDGNFQVAARMGRELRALQRQGYSTVVVESKGDNGLDVIQGGDRFLGEIE